MTINQRIAYAGFVVLGITAVLGMMLLWSVRTPNVAGATTGDVGLITRAQTSASTTVSNSVSTQVTATSTSRRHAWVCNDSTNVVFLGFGNNAIMDRGIRVQSGDCFEIGGSKPLIRTAINAIASTSASNVSYIDVTGTEGTFGN